MIVVYPFSVSDQNLALKNAKWMNELGGCKGHEVAMLHDKRCNPLLVKAVEAELDRAFDHVHLIESTAEIDGWPEGANYFFRVATSWMANTNKWPYFMWMEPDAIPMHPGWLDSIQREFIACRKPFMGDRVQVEDIPLHMSGIGVYPNPMHKFAGEAYRAAEIAWDMAGKDQIVPQAHFTKLIEHAWKHPTFTSHSELATQIRHEAVVFHSSKDGSLIDLLRNTLREEITTPVTSAATSVTMLAHKKDTEEPVSPPSIPLSHFPTTDIFIRTYPGDYKWLYHCLRSINKFCTGFRKVFIVSTEDNPMPTMGYEWKQMNDECGDGYLAQQITKMYADVILDYQPDMILHVDSDVIFTRTTTPEDFMSAEGKPLWFYTPYNTIETPWKPITEKFMGRPVENEFMRRFPIMVPRWLYPKVREFCHRKHGVTMTDYIRNQPLRAFSEFNALGAYAFQFHHGMFSWWNTVTLPGLPQANARQFHSWGGITPEVENEIKKIFGERVVDSPPPTAGESKAGTVKGDRTPPPPGIEELSNGIWIIADDTHIGKWVRQEGRLDHDQNTLPFLLPLIKEGDVVIDAGANIGDHTIAYLRKVGSIGTVHAFEPNPMAMACLKHNLISTENGGHNYSLCTYQVGLSDKSDVVPLSGNNNNYGGAYVGDHMPVANVPIMRLDDFHLKPNFIKLDIEGSEVKALIGMQETIRECHPVMVIEVNVVALERQGNTVGQLLALLESHGYEWKIMQENCSEFDPLYDIVCVHKESPEVSVQGNGKGGLTRCTSDTPPVTSSKPINDMLTAVLFLKEFAAKDTNHRLRVMMNLSKNGLVPRHRNKKTKRHETTKVVAPKAVLPSPEPPPQKGRDLKDSNARRQRGASKPKVV